MGHEDGTATVKVEEARQVCVEILAGLGAPGATAHAVVHALIDNERRAHRSHGLLRILDYVQDVETGRVDPTANPTVDLLAPVVRKVDGHRCFGVLAAAEVARQLVQVSGTAGPGVGVVALVRSGHLGRLADIGRAATAGGAVVLGFVNFLGAGQRVAPWGGSQGRLCTNPLLVAVPAEPAPFVLDMSTSTVAEGKVRERWLDGAQVPAGWLTTTDGRPTRDPAGLYATRRPR
jgi:LDH2 family malate/lactate/ureidoglycolate dehydrogenase